MSQPEILVFFSDQHDARLIHALGNDVIRTPNLDRLVADGTAFDCAYTSFPLCVPARMSFLTGQLASRTGVVSNSTPLGQGYATFAHMLALAGYDTTLCGRMHFVGPDQRHGFTQRLVGDMTPLYWHRTGIDDERGPAFTGNYAQDGCLTSIGAGNSPVLEFDRAVADAAVGHLAIDHEKPQCTVVGTYGPHFPYFASKERYEYYRDRVELPPTYKAGCNDDHPAHQDDKKPYDPETARKAMAAYYGMIEELDEHIGRVRDAFDTYCQRKGTEGLFVYMSDHGDMNGDHNQYGKQCFYEGSARIPLIWCGANIRSGARIQMPTSIMDIGPTLCASAGAALPPAPDGTSLLPVLNDGHETSERHILSEVIDHARDGTVYTGRMVRKGAWKFFTYPGYEKYDRLYDLKNDPHEQTNLAATKPNLAAELRALAMADWDPAAMRARRDEMTSHYAIVDAWYAEHGPREDERWRSPNLDGQYLLV